MSAQPTTAERAHGASLRSVVKAAVFILCVVAVAPLIFCSWIEKRMTGSELLFTSASQALALIPSFPGTWLRGAFYWGALEHCSWQVHIGFGSLFSHRGVRLGHRVSMGNYCVIGHADIGDGAMIGSRVSIPSGKRQHFDDEGRLTAGTTRFERVAIGANAWIGEGAIVMADIGERSVVSAGAVVTKPAPAGALIGGNPARVIRALDAPVSTEGST